MAAINESTAPLNDDLNGLSFEIQLGPKTDENGNPRSVAERILWRFHLPVDRDDGRPGHSRVQDWTGLTDQISTFTQGDAAKFRGLLVKLFKHAKTAEGL